MELIFAFLAGLLTLINPCVLPVIPIAVSSASSGNRAGPLALAAGMGLTFVILGVALSAIGPSVGITVDTMSRIGAFAMIGFGLVLLVKPLGDVFARAAQPIAYGADMRLSAAQTGVRRGSNGLIVHFLGGALLGAVWSPCIGPTLGGAIALASQGQSLLWASAVMISFSVGVAVIILALAYGTQEAIKSRQSLMRKIAEKSKTIMGVVFVLIGLAILLNLHKWAEIALLDAMPIWLQNLSVRF